MITIYKFPLAVTDEQVVAAYADTEWLSVGDQFGVLYAWAVVDTASPPSAHRFRIVGTGNPADALAGWKFLGSVQQYGGQLVWHVFVAETAA